jgi:oxalate---CoA ligase
LETRLAKIWEDLLEDGLVGVNDNFMEQGGDSLLAVRLLCRVQEEFGIELSLLALDRAPTLGELADTIRGRGATSSSSLVEFRSAGPDSPLYCLPGSGGYFLSYAKLVSRGVPDRPIFGLRYDAFAQHQRYNYRIEELAAHCIGEIRARQPQGPYWLGGYSFGGIVAFEIAQQLIRQNQEIALLALFDAWAPGFPRISPPLQRIGLHARKIMQLDSWGRMRYVTDRMRSAARKLGRLAGVPSDHRKSDPQLDPVRKLENANHRAAERYVPRPYPDRITLFRANTQHQAVGVDTDEPTLGWGGLSESGVKVHSIPGAHDSIFHEPHVNVLVEKLGTYFPIH